MNCLAVSVDFSVASVVKPFGTNGKSFNTGNTEDTENAKHQKVRPSSRQLEECRKLRDRKLFRACILRETRFP